MTFLITCLTRKIDYAEADKQEVQRRRDAVKATTQLIAEIVVDANIRSEMRGVEKKVSGKKK